MVIYFFSGTMITLFLIGGLGIAFAAYQALQSILGIIITVVSVAIVALSIIFTIIKLTSSVSDRKLASSIFLEVVTCLIASLLVVKTTQLFANDLLSYGDGILEMFVFAVCAMACAAPWCCSVGGWLQILGTEEPKDYLIGFAYNIGGFAALYALVL